MNAFTAMLMDEQGAALVEYALVLAFFALGAIAGLTLVSGAVNNVLKTTAQQLSNNQAQGG